MFLDRLALALGRTTAWCFAAIVLIMVYEVVARYAFNAPTSWAHETSILLASIGFVFGGAFCMAEGTHMRITLLVEKWPRLARFSDAVSLLAGLIYLGGLTYAAWRMAERAVWRFSLNGAWDPERSGSTLNSPLPSYLKALLFVGCALFLLLALKQAAALVFGRRGNAD
ncbi:TRAP transporter small permease [Aestuariivita sp.]|jgi:TRAP-type C4-dicarboxylate transport system permease small subunit|uniref:TRAP transporter small permease subunit n=1 Tax=Aestuariivita sp. TaxID=1872407 RepID=UPI00216DB6B5|nr:TRAP transporter small permease [Aestuariivita sp.]MCE8009035.1 TRAP transporter small permease [Aestuariivita sp.]